MPKDVVIEDSSPAPKKSKRNVVLVIIGFVLLLALAGAGLWYQNDQAEKKQAEQAKKITELEKQVTDLQKQLADAKASSGDAAKTLAPSATTISNIKDAISSGNYAALEGYMAPSVTVIIAASEGIGTRTPAQATADMAYTDAGTDPWNFALPAATIATYAAGPYAQYFPANVLVGVSANKYVVAFSFDNNGKIKTIFLAANTDLLT